MKVYMVHWHAAEAVALSKPLQTAGHEVTLHTERHVTPSLGTQTFDVMVISLERLPSHGQAIAEWFWSAKKRQHIPIIFAGGAIDKVTATRQQFPKASYCALAEIVGTLSAAGGVTA